VKKEGGERRKTGEKYNRSRSERANGPKRRSHVPNVKLAGSRTEVKHLKLEKRLSRPKIGASMPRETEVGKKKKNAKIIVAGERRCWNRKSQGHRLSQAGPNRLTLDCANSGDQWRRVRPNSLDGNQKGINAAVHHRE